jgi:hypothetical protein
LKVSWLAKRRLLRVKVGHFGVGSGHNLPLPPEDEVAIRRHKADLFGGKGIKTGAFGACSRYLIKSDLLTK